MSDSIIIENGDHFTVVPDPDSADGRVIKIENTVWIQEPRWFGFAVAGKHDRAAAINELIDALTKLRDAGQ